MFFTYVLAYILVVSTEFGGSIRLKQKIYDESEVKNQENNTEEIHDIQINSSVIGNTHISTLKYVLAIQNSSIWTDVKKRSLTISTNPRLTDIINTNPEDLNDDDLELLMRACHDGLKCVAVDQLSVLSSTKEPLGDGTVSVRKAISKITHVLTNYTNEYHEETCEYEEVQDTDDPSKVTNTVTEMVEDNKELCKLKVGDDSVIKAKETLSTTVTKDSKHDIATIKALYISRGNVATATSDDVEDTDEKSDSSSDAHDIHQLHGDSDSSASNIGSVQHYPHNSSYSQENGNQERESQGNDTHEREIQNCGTQNHDAIERNSVSNDQSKLDHLTNTRASFDEDAEKRNSKSESDIDATRPTDKNASTNTDVTPKTVVTVKSDVPSEPDMTSKSDSVANSYPLVSNDSSTNIDASENTLNSKSNNKTSGDSKSNVVNLANGDRGSGGDGGSGAGENDGFVDIISSGNSNRGEVKKGYAENGIVNNGDMKIFNVHVDKIDKSVFNKSDTEGGIANIGTVNNETTVHGNSNNYENYGVHKPIDSHDFIRYLSSIDAMYSSVTDGFKEVNS